LFPVGSKYDIRSYNITVKMAVGKILPYIAVFCINVQGGTEK